MSDARLAFLDAVLSKENAPYLWGAKGPDNFDCSGLVTWALLQAGCRDWRQTHSSHVLWNVLEPLDELVETDGRIIQKPQPGDLAFYGAPGRINHVMVVWGDGRVIGACGGNSDTTGIAEALKRNAKVRFRSSLNYRPDFRGYRKLPLKDRG